MKILDQDIETGDDIFAVRQRARRLAGMVGFDESDQVRIATALSEVARDVLGDHRGRGTISFSVGGRPQVFVVVVEGLRGDDGSPGVGLAAARRLMPTVELEVHAGGRRLLMSRPLPQDLTDDRIGELGTRMTQQAMTTPLDELRIQNRELAATLEALTARQHELVALNAELEETNRGVMAMYTELAGELESTNRGVVALYAELDDAALQLRRSSEAKSRFLANVSHELRSPVTAILGLSKLLLDDGGDGRREVQLINRSADELLGLVNELLDLAKAESGRLVPTFVPVDLTGMVGELCDALRPLAADGVALVVSGCDDELTIEADVDLLRHTIRNLVANALAFTMHGQVGVSVAHHAAGVDIAVTDTGIGIAEEHIGRIFEEFFQVRGPLQARRKGTGLGLAYAKAVIEALGGSIEVASALGIGSTFTVHLTSSAARGRDRGRDVAGSADRLDAIDAPA